MLIVGNDASLVQIREEFRTNKKSYRNGVNEDIPIATVAAMSAGFVLNDNMIEFGVSCK